ncbi:MAG: DUF47 domain-containing protein [Fastidiosipilaceae bacterium]
MAFFKKKEIDYYERFDQAGSLATKAARRLEELMDDYTDVAKKATEIHNIENEADIIYHKTVKDLSRAFITPIDREDILQIAGNIDDIVDYIEDIANMMEMFSIRQIPQPAKDMTALIVRSCTALEMTVNEFRHFKKSHERLAKLIIQVNQFEEEGDRFYRQTVKDLYLTETNPVELMKWKEIYDKMEDTLDVCEEVANLLEAMAIKNS